MITTRTTCRVCGSKSLTFLFSLGDQYVSNFVEKDKVQSGPHCSIDLVLCMDCTLVQQLHTAPQELLYTGNYWYFSSTTKTMRDTLKEVVDDVQKEITLKAKDIVLDIGSNDGTLLRFYKNPNIIKVGVEPAKNMKEAGNRGVDVFIPEFWSAEAYFNAIGKRGASSKAKIITACGMFYDLEDPNQFIADIAKVLHPEGIFVAQLMCLKNMIDSLDVGNMAHEHLEFYSLQSLNILLQRHGLKVTDMLWHPVNGGSYRFYIQHLNRPDATSSFAYNLQKEKELGLHKPAYYAKFYQNLVENRDECVNYLEQQAREGKKIWIYGASTKGNVILQWYNLYYHRWLQTEKPISVFGKLIPTHQRLIQGAVDVSPDKIGKYTIGSGIPITTHKEAKEKGADYFLVLPYAFAEEFMKIESEWRSGGGKFIFPLPKFTVV